MSVTCPERPVSEWTMWAMPTDIHETREYLNVHSDRRTTAAYWSQDKVSIVQVTVTEDPDGQYLGWIDADREVPTLIQYHTLYSMQFPYGPKAEEERGRGRTVTLRITEDED